MNIFQSLCIILLITDIRHCRELQDRNQLHYDDTSFTFIRNITQLIENKYPSTNVVLEIQSSSCHVAGTLLCTYLIKMLFAIYNVDPVLPNDKIYQIEPVTSNHVFFQIDIYRIKQNV